MSRYPGRILSSTAPTVNANTAKGIWTLDEALRYSRAGQWPIPTGNGDPYFQYNTMLLPGQGTNGAQNNTFLDSSTNNFTITRNGNTTQGTFTPFSGANGYWSTYLNGSSSLSVNVSGISAGTSTFTLEFWVYLIAYPGTDAPFVDTRTTNGASTTAFQFGVYSTGKLKFYDGTETNLNGSVPLNQWTHIALVRDSGNTVTAYINGVSTGTTVSSTRNFSDNYFWIASVPAPASPYINGFLSNLRWVVGSAVYTSAFTPPTSPLTAITNTKLLTLQSNRFVDNSANAYAITLNSTPQITPFQPFGAPTSAYSASTIGGSGYFDGSGDYLSIGTQTAFGVGTGACTIETWFYPTATGVYQGMISCRPTGANIGLCITNTNQLQFTLAGADLTASGIQWNAWNHAVGVRSTVGGTTTTSLFLNGTRVVTNTTTTGDDGSTRECVVGRYYTDQNNYYFTGWIAGSRILKGTAAYDPTASSITVPTAPFTNVANTSVLFNFTNAGIIDNAEKNDLETVGNAQISTSQYKWGASSMYFDGTGDYLIVPTSQNYVMGTGDFTVEMWLRTDVIPSGTYDTVFDTRPASTNGAYLQLYLDTDGKLKLWVSSADRITSTTAIAVNTWYHVVVARTGGSTKMFINGNQTGSTYADTTNYIASNLIIGASYGGGSSIAYAFNGYINDFRISKGLNRYPYNFTAPTAALPLFYQAAATPSADPYFDYTTLLLPGNGTNGAQNNTFLDSSTNAFTITRNGNTTQGTFTPFSQTGWSNNFNGSSWFTNGTTISLGTNDFCMEAWYFGTGGDVGLISQRTTGNANGWTFNSGKFTALVGGSWLDPVVGNNAFGVANQWTHIAVTRSGTAFRFFINGVLVSYATASGSVADQNIPTVGAGSAGGEGPFNGYISNLRVCNGSIPTSYQTSATSVGTTVFTPPTTAVTTTSQGAANVTYLTCQSNRFVDNSSVARTLTFNGTPTVQAFSPFNPTAAYSTSTVGGSGYFDGTGDYLSSTFTATTIFSGNATFEGWVYFNTVSGQQVIYRENTSGTGFNFGSNGTALQIDDTVNGGSVFATSAGVIKANEWNHIAVTRSSNTFTIYVNGTSVGTNSSVYTFFTGNTSGFLMGSVNGSSNMLNGYICSARVSNIARTITVPTAPYTSDANTKILLNYTNGGIIDNTAKNNLETVGGASISTTVSKFGGSSMYFDGTGDFLQIRSTPNLNYGSGDLTFEAWLYISSFPSWGSIGTIISNRANGSSVGGNFFIAATNQSSSNKIKIWASSNGSSHDVFNEVDIATGLSTNTWFHLAITRNGSSWKAYVNGTESWSTTSSSTLYTSTQSTYIGADSSSNGFTGYINDLRITKGIARYTTNFTPPATAFLTL